MLSSVSWNQYLSFVALAVVAYYLFIWVVFYKAKVPVLFGMGRIQIPSFHVGDAPDEVLETVRHLMDELKPVFSGCTGKNELILALQQKLKRYSSWNEPGFRESVNEFIASESDSTCSIRLSDSDLRAVWS